MSSFHTVVKRRTRCGHGYGFSLEDKRVFGERVSTQQVSLNGINFIVDTYHDRILYNDTPNLGYNLFSWKVMADDFNKPHSISSDGNTLHLVTDTDNNRVATYTRLPSGEFIELQSFENVGIRPHYCVYDAPSASLLCMEFLYGRCISIREPPELMQ